MLRISELVWPSTEIKYETMDSEKINENCLQQWKKTCYRISSLSRGHIVTFQGPCDRSTYTPMPQQNRDFLIFQ